MDDEHSFYVFLFLPWKKMFSVKISFVVHGRRMFFLHFLASPLDDEHSFFCFTIFRHGRRVFWPESAHTCEVSSGVDAQEDE